MTNEQKEDVIKRIKKHIHQEKNGYCAIFWAMKQVMGQDYNPKPHIIQSIASKITQSGKYKVGFLDMNNLSQTTIVLNPDSNIIVRNPVVSEVIRFILTVGSALLVYHLTS